MAYSVGSLLQPGRELANADCESLVAMLCI
jgi:hypothetical protein